MAAQIEHD